MSQAIVFPSGGGITVSYIAPSTVLTPDEVAAQVVPEGVEYRVVDITDLPPSPPEAWTANFDDQPCVVTTDPDKLAAADRVAELARVEQWFEDSILEGFKYEDTIRLGLRTEDVALLTGNYVLAKEAAALGLSLPPIIGSNGTVHTFESIEDMTALMLAYGQYRAALSAEYASKKAALSDS